MQAGMGGRCRRMRRGCAGGGGRGEVATGGDGTLVAAGRRGGAGYAEMDVIAVAVLPRLPCGVAYSSLSHTAANPSLHCTHLSPHCCRC